jgi:CubicO group peptidase (beta-lactamase class C family)
MKTRSLIVSLLVLAAASGAAAEWPGVEWKTATAESQGMSAAGLEAAAAYTQKHGGGSGCVIRNGLLVKEWGSPTKRADIKSATKGAIGATVLGLALDSGLVKIDDRAQLHYPAIGAELSSNVAAGWLREITVHHLATMTAGFDDGRPPKLVRRPASGGQYSNDTTNMLAELLTLRFKEDLAVVLKREVMDPIGVPAGDWAWRENSYRPKSIGGLSSREFASGITITHRALARIGYLYLRDGEWNGKRILSKEFIRLATRPTKLPGPFDYYAFYWGSNAKGTYPEMPKDTYWALGLGDSFVAVCPSLDVVAVRLGEGSVKTQLPGGEEDWGKRVAGFFRLVAESVSGDRPAAKPATAKLNSKPAASKSPAASPYPRSPVIKGLRWSPKETIVRAAKGSDNWPLTWGDDDAIYAAYGDGVGFEPFAAKKLSLGLAKIDGTPPDVRGVNLRSGTLEQIGDGANGRKASGLLMVDGVLYLWARNAGNAQLAWSVDRGLTWTWSDWKIATSFGCPTFLNFGRNYAGSRDEFVYVYSHDSESAYKAADGIVLARASKSRLRDRGAYEFFAGFGADREPRWSRDVQDRRAVLVDPGRCFRSSASYHAPTGRYLLVHTIATQRSRDGGGGIDTRFAGGLAIYDAPQPWGPWTSLYSTDAWDVGPGDTASFPTKWMDEAGGSLYLVYSGDDGFSVRRAEIVVD